MSYLWNGSGRWMALRWDGDGKSGWVVNRIFSRNDRLVIVNITRRSCGLLIFVQVVAVFL